MIPNVDSLQRPIEEFNFPTNTYKLVVDPNLIKDDSIYMNRVSEYTDDLAAVKQAVYLILSIERYKYIIYSWNYGVELHDLFGKPLPYVQGILPERITEALTMDDRITDVNNFEFTKNGKKLGVKFTVVTNVGKFDTDLEVEV
mgnify:CR=1 FL=1